MGEKHPDVIGMLNSIIFDRNEELARAVALLRRLEWNLDDGKEWAYCLVCRMCRDSGHSSKCELAKILGENQ